MSQAKPRGLCSIDEVETVLLLTKVQHLDRMLECQIGNPTKNSRLRDVLHTMTEKHIQVLALSEVQWSANKSLQINENLIIYSGLSKQQSDNLRSGVVIVLGEEATMAWKAAGAEYDNISDRLLRTRFNMHTWYLSVIAVYAPTNEDTQIKDSEKFYEELQEAVCGVPKQKTCW